jgi:hypothetical protein
MSDSKEWHDLTSEKAREMRMALLGGMWRALTFAAAIAVFVGFIAAYSHGVKAEEIPVHVYDDGGTVIQLMPSPCVDPAVKPFLESVGELERFKAVDSIFLYRDGQRKRHGGCWAEFSAKEAGAPEAIFVIFFDDGDKAVIPKAEFLRGKGSGT